MEERAQPAKKFTSPHFFPSQLEGVAQAFAQWTHPQRCVYFIRVLELLLAEKQAELALERSLDTLFLDVAASSFSPPLPSSSSEGSWVRCALADTQSRLAATAELCGPYESPPRLTEALTCFQRWTNTTRIDFEHMAESIDSSATDAFIEALAMLRF